MKFASHLLAFTLALSHTTQASSLQRRDNHHDHNSHQGTASLTSIRKPGKDGVMSLSLMAENGGSKAVNKDSGTGKVNQDGHDIAYFFNMELGKGQNFSLVVDTGSYYTWVYGANCTADACKHHKQYDSAKSDHASKVNDDFAIKYTSGDIKGAFWKDRAQFAGFDMDMQFGVADKAGDVFESFPIDGILGMSAKDKDAKKNPGLLELLKQQKLIEDKIFAVNLGRSANKNDQGSITFGGTDKSKYKGDISWNKIDQSANSMLWMIDLDNTYYNDTKMGFDKRTAIVDTGSTLLTLPPKDAEKFHSYFKGATGDEDGNYVVPCNSSVEISMEFGGKNWTIPPEDYISDPVNDNKEMCSTMVRGLKIQGNNDDQWLVGDVFLKNVYTVFDVDEQRVGFAEKKAGPTKSTPRDKYKADESSASSQSASSASGSSNSTSSSSSSSSKASGTALSSSSQSASHSSHGSSVGMVVLPPSLVQLQLTLMVGVLLFLL